MILHANFYFADTSNNVFFVEFEPLSHTFSCQFIGHYENKSCAVTYGRIDTTDQICNLENQFTQMNSSDITTLDSLTVNVPSLPQTDHQSKLICFRAVGTTSVFTAAVEGSFIIGNEVNTDNNFITQNLILLVLCIHVTNLDQVLHQISTQTCQYLLL